MRHILIVEDDPELADFLKSQFEMRHFRVTVAHRGETAKAAISTYYPDLILLDLGLPDMPGEEVCRFVKHSYDPLMRHIPVVMLTGKDADVDRVVGMVMGAAAYIAKPPHMRELLDKITHLLAA